MLAPYRQLVSELTGKAQDIKGLPPGRQETPFKTQAHHMFNSANVLNYMLALT